MPIFNQRGPTPYYRPVASLPWILCGPMVRKVSRHSVSVFLALKHPCKVSLRLYDGADGGGHIKAGEFQDTLPLGRNLHMIVVTLDTDVALESGRKYGYDLEFENPGLPGGLLALSADVDGLLLERGLFEPGSSAITYPGEKFPSFVFPSMETAKLRMVHGSCRKPHGDGPDMLAMLDDLLAAKRSDLDERPQLLLLTGDQIYADDVSPVLLRCLNDSLPMLLGWRETVSSPHFQAFPGNPLGILPDELTQDMLSSDGTWSGPGFFETFLGNPGHLFNPARASRIAPTRRGEEVIQNAGLSTEESASHLLFLGEFVLMYLFCWSDALWPRETAPHGDNASPVDSSGVLYRNGPFRLPGPQEAVPSLSLFGKFSQTNLKGQRETLLTFVEGLKKVRRALANIATYMIFDDHEITDDWNLNFDWVKRVNTSPLGPSLLRNGLTAYALCQDWGSQPEQYYGDGPGVSILEAVRYQGKTDAAPAWLPDQPPPEPPEPAPAIVTTVSGDLFQLLGIGPVHYVNPPLKTWHYVIEPYGAQSEYRIILLDTRTRRGFPAQNVMDQAASGLKSLLNVTGPFTGLVLNAALLSDAAFAEQLDAGIEPLVVNIIVSPAPVFGVSAVEQVLQKGMMVWSGPEAADSEAWTGNQAAFQSFVAYLRTRKKGAIVLSGDVHYGFSQLIRFNVPGSDPTRYEDFSTLQLCASSLKNQSFMTRGLGGLDPRLDAEHFLVVSANRAAEFLETIEAKILEKRRELHLDDGFDPIEDPMTLHNYVWKGWFNPTPAFYDPLQFALMIRDLNPFSLPSPLMLPIRALFGLELARGLYDFQQELLNANPGFSVKPLTDIIDANKRTGAVDAINAGRVAPSNVIVFAADQERLFVGHNNLGEIGFMEGAPMKVRHTLYRPVYDRANKAYAPYAATTHLASL